MGDEHRELLSALMDGEISELELRRLLKHGDDGIEAEWARMHAARQVLREGDLPFAQCDVSAGVSAALETLPAQRMSGRGLLRPVAGLAIAAGVAAVVVWSGGQLPGTQPPLRAEVATASLPTRVVSPSANPATGSVAANASSETLAAVPDSVARDRFRRHMLRHTQRAVDNSGHGVFSYARVVYEVND